MNVRPIRSNDLPALYDLYCRVTASLAHGFPPTRQEFQDAFAGRPVNHSRTATLLSETRGRIAGFARVGRHVSAANFWTRASEGEGLLFGPLFAPGDEVAALELVRAADAQVRAMGATIRFAFEPGEAATIRFYNGGWMGCSDQLPHILRILLESGFRIQDRELNLTLLAAVADSPEPAGIALRMTEVEENKLQLAAYCGDRTAGMCYFSRMYPRRSKQPEANAWGYIDGLGVEEPFRERGVGRALIVQAARKLRDLGCGPICLTTGQSNLKAQNLYFSMGFALVGSSVTLERREDGQ